MSPRSAIHRYRAPATPLAVLLLLGPLAACPGNSPAPDASSRDLKGGDLKSPPAKDLAPPADLAVADLAPPADLAVADLAVAADLAPPADLSPPPDLLTCRKSIDGAGTGSFTIEFTLTTTAKPAADMAVIGQRAVCSNAVMWDVRMGPSGQLNIEVDNNDNPYTSFTTQHAVNDGKPHAVVLARHNGALVTTIDGVVDTPAQAAAQSYPAGSLPPISIGTDICDGQDGTVPLSGMVTDVCLFLQ